MKRMKYLFGMFMIAILLFGHSGCAMVASHVAVAGGKKVYEKIEEDRANDEHVDHG